MNIYREFRLYGSTLLRRPRAPQTKFLIFSQRRSGTALLVNLLHSHPDIHCEHEILAERVLFPKLYVAARSRQSKRSTYGFKLLVEQLVDPQQIAEREKFVLDLHESGFHFIYLRRVDVVRHTLSGMYAVYRQVHHRRTSDAPLAHPKMEVDLGSLAAAIRDVEIFRLMEKRLLRNVPHLCLSYEEDLLLADRHQATVDAVADFVGIPRLPVATDMVKVTPENLSDFIANVDEVNQFVRQQGYS